MAQYIGGSHSAAFSRAPIPIGEGLSGWVAEHKLPIVNGNPTVEPNCLKAAGLFTAESSALSVPLFGSSDAVLGVLTVYSAKSAAFSKEHLHVLQAVQTKFALALEDALVFGSADTHAPGLTQSAAKPTTKVSSAR